MMCISIKSLTVYFPLDLSSSLFLFKLFIYLTLLGLSYGTLDLQSSLQHAGSLVVAELSVLEGVLWSHVLGSELLQL